MSLFLRLMIVAGLLASCVPTAEAFPQFMKQFVAQYLEADDNQLPELGKKEGCFVCHQGKKKKNRNAYGNALHEHLGKKDKKDVEKILAALETVAGESSDPATEGAPTFGELIAEGKYPGGPIEESKEEPAPDEGESGVESEG